MLVSLAVAVALVIGSASLLLAQSSGPAKSAAKKASRKVSGTVRSSSPDIVVVSGRDKGKDAEWTFAVDPTTNIRKGSKAIVPGDLKAGDAVQIRFVERDGKAVAQSIVVKGPRKDAKKTAVK
jgi:hypothetical protein